MVAEHPSAGRGDRGPRMDFFPKQTYPIRSGVHPNTAFALCFALDYARAVGDERFAKLIEERSRFYFAGDAGIPANGSRAEPTSSRRAWSRPT